MNQKQRETIRDQIERVVDPLVARYRERCEARNEPFQVMNLENVQGHERDIVLISMTYGPGPNRAVVDQRFGPIIKSQGHRRLNVLFTRARRRIGLFASMASSDIRDTGSPNRGARVLKSYLGYVERHGAAAGEHTGRSPDSPFEREVAERLRTRGFEVDPQVGVSGFRIDLGIRHRAQPTLYVAGVECDGAAYHSSRSARDRDRLREEVLADLGWRLVRVWSTDWFSDPDRETDRLVCALEALEVQPARTSDVALFRTSEAPADGGETHPVGPEAHAGASGQSDPAASLQGPDQPIPDPPGLTLLNGQAPLSEDQARLALEALRRTVIEADHPEVRPEASILRETMIDCFVSIRFDDPDDWLKRVPMYLRQRTDPGQRKYLGQICDVLQRMAPTHP